MSRKKPFPTDDPISGITTRHGQLIRVQLGRNTIIDLEKGEWHDVYGKRISHPIDDKTARSLQRQAREWMKIPPGSIHI